MQLTRAEKEFEKEFIFIPPYENHKKMMDIFFATLASRLKQEQDPVELAAFAHTAVAVIHPFKEGNGRTARLLMNSILVSNGYKPVVFFSEREYAKSLDRVEKDFNAPNFKNLLRHKIKHTQEKPELYSELERLVAEDNFSSTSQSRSNLQNHLMFLIQEKQIFYNACLAD